MDQYIQQALAGDEMAIGHLTTMHKPRLLAKAYTFIKNKQDAEDIVQETFIKAFGALAQLKEPNYFATWLYKILIRESFFAIKKKERTKLLELEIMEQLQLLDQENSEDYSALHNAVASLKKDYQTAIVLHYFYDFKVFEIAEMLGKPNNTIKMHLHRGRKALRLKLEETMQQPLQQKDVKRMLKEQLFDLAQQYANVPAHYELELEDYHEDGITSFMWKGQSKDEGVFIRLDDKGRLDDFAKTPTKEGTPITEEMKLEIAERLLREQYPEALSYYTLVEQKKKELSTSFKYGQVVSGFPLDGFYCRIEVTDSGEVIYFTYTGYMENPPEMPKELYPTERILNTLYEGDWSLCAESFNKKYASVPGIYAIYESELLTQSYDAVTGKPLYDYDVELKRSYVPFPKIEALPKKDTIEEIVGINENWEQYEEGSMDEAYEELNWRPKSWQDSKDKSYDSYMKSKFENRVKVKVNKRTKRLDSFIWFAEIEGEAKLFEEECLQIAAQFIQTYYPEYTPYLHVEIKDEEYIEENRAFFRFVVQKNGFSVENEFFHMNICKKTGSILMLSAPNITVEDIEKFEPKAIKPIKELLPLKGLKVQLEWGKVYGKTEKDEDEMRFIYRIQMTDGAFIKAVNAESGEVMKYNFPILRKEDLEQPLEFDAVIPTISRGKGKYLVRKGDL
ncbi:MAG: sigma-70 family RNA polymerase sigma factor [Solibacillus sp.]|uniref:sigma-70 family RNA polymerase sigma factor n=1 Tax=Solibacillus sp. TaxID=1909654 RepID=UPI003315335F